MLAVQDLQLQRVLRQTLARPSAAHTALIVIDTGCSHLPVQGDTTCGSVWQRGVLQCPKVRWQQCPKCQARMREEGLADEYQLQSWFIRRISTFLKQRGKRIIGWDEILEGGLAPDAIVMSWRVTHMHASRLTRLLLILFVSAGA